MDTSKITYAEVKAAAGELLTSAGQMQTLLGEVAALFNKIGGEGVWAGTAAAPTKDEFDKLSNKFPEFYDTVTACGNYLNSVVQNFESTDSSVTGGGSSGGGSGRATGPVSTST